MPDYETMPGRMKRKISYGLFFIGALLLLSGAVMLLWNALLPKLLHVAAINYWQALGLMVLGRILFGRFGFGSGFGGWGGRGRQFMKDKLMTMSDEDRAAFKEEWRKRCERRGDR